MALVKGKEAAAKKPVKKAAAGVEKKVVKKTGTKAKPAGAASKEGLLSIQLRAVGGVSKWVVLSIKHQDADSIQLVVKKPRSSTEVEMLLSVDNVQGFAYEKGDQVVYIQESTSTFKVVEGTYSGVKNGFAQFKTADGVVQVRKGWYKAASAGVKGL